MAETKYDSAVFIMDDVQVVDKNHSAKGTNWNNVNGNVENGYMTSSVMGFTENRHEARAPYFSQPRGKKHEKNVIVPR